MSSRRGGRFSGQTFDDWLLELAYLPADALARIQGDDPLWPWLLSRASRAVDFLRLATWMDASHMPRVDLVMNAIQMALDAGPRDLEWWDVEEWRETLLTLRSLTEEQRQTLLAAADRHDA